ncbi:hypothetical protein WJX84_002714 [Apatococcus fuscideae]|uniref:Peroxin/Ferlin domain-containing protein n=1 Tax=Apatococcus fuscideae TaxID=2026836 RepID=A0AAW1T7B2_9CHLO
MFEAQLAFYLNKYLGAYVYGVDAHSLKVSVFQGDVVLENLQLKPEALADLNLPVVVRSGLVGSLKLKVPWASLGKSPVLVEMDRVYILAGSKEASVESTGESTETDFEAAARDAKRRRIHDAEMAWVQGDAAASEKQATEGGQGGGRFRAIIDTVIGNLQLSITNVHIRFEDNVSVPGMPLAAGLTIESLSSHTVDEKGNKAFVTHNPLELLRKAAELQSVSLHVSRPQYQSIQSLLGEFSAYAARVPNKHLRPASRPLSAKACKQWWHYAATVILQRTQRNKVYWKQLSVVCSLRKQYVPMYIACLQNGQMGGDKEIEDMDAQLPEASIKVFRRLAHAKVEQEKRRAAAAAAAEKQAKAASTWWGWATGAGKAKSPEDAANQQDDMRADLTADEYSKLEDMVSEQEQAVKTGAETPTTLRMQLQVQIGSMAAALDHDDGSQIVHSGMQNLQSTVKLYPETKEIFFSVEGVGVVAPNGSLLETGAPHRRGAPKVESKAALNAFFVQKPQDGRADAALDLSLGSSYVTYNLQTINQIADFFKTQQAMDLSALGAQAVAQIDRARQAAKDQLQAALDQKPKLLLHVSLDAPKVAIPVAASSTGEGQLTLVADLGHFTLESDVALVSSLTAEKASLYECLKLDGKDLSAYLVASLNFFFSPARIARVLRVMKAALPAPEEQAKGVGGTSATWPKRHAFVHKGTLYLLENAKSASPSTTTSFWTDRHVVKAPAEACGGLDHVLAILPDGADVAGVAENPDAVLLRLRDHAEADDWIQHLKGSQRIMREMVGSINDSGSSEDTGDWDTNSAAGAEVGDAISQEQGQTKPEGVKFVISAELGELALHVSGRPPEVWQVPQAGTNPLGESRASTASSPGVINIDDGIESIPTGNQAAHLPGAAKHHAWVLEFESWKPDSPEYSGLDAQLQTRLTSLLFFCNRPTVAALMCFGTDLGEALKAGQLAKAPAPSQPRQLESQESVSDFSSLEEPGNLVKSGGEERTVMRVIAAIEKLEVTLQYEGVDTPPLALASMEDISVSLNVHPSTLALKGSLGNLRATDTTLPEGHPYQHICTIRKGAESSLIELEFASHQAHEAQAGGRMDVKLAAPVITMPRSTDSSDSMQIDLGSLHLTNTVRFVRGSQDNLSEAVIVEHDSLIFKDISAVVSADGKRGNNIIREYEQGMQLDLRRPVHDPPQNLPGIELSISMPSIKATLSDRAVAPLAHFSIKTVWLALRMTSSGSMYLSLSVPQVQAADQRPWVPEEHSLVISSAHTSMDLHDGPAKGKASPTLKPSFMMLEFEQHPAKALQNIRITLQRPTVVAEIGFLLAVTKFFVPTMAISGVSPIPFVSQDIYLEGKQLLRVLHCTFVNQQYHHSFVDPIPLIVVGYGKTLILTNVKIIHAASMHACVDLASGSQVVAHPEDNVEKFEGMDPTMARPQSATAGLTSGKLASQSRTWSTGFSRGSMSTENERRPAQAPKQTLATLQLSIAAVGMGLRFVELEQTDLEKHVLRGTLDHQKAAQQGVKGGTTRMLAAYLDAGAKIEMQGDRQKIDADLRGLRIETQTNVTHSSKSQKTERVHGHVLEPCKISVHVDMAKGAGDASVLEPLVQPSADRPLSKCNKFGKLWSNNLDGLGAAEAATEVSILGSASGATFWRPKPAIGYVALGDCITSGSMQPAFQVISVAVNSGIIAYPVRFKAIWSSAKLSVWQPEAPAGYVAIGCLVTTDHEPPAVTEIGCLHQKVLVEAPVGQLLNLKPPPKPRQNGGAASDLVSFDSGHLDACKYGYVWCVENCAATFWASADGHAPAQGMALDLRSPLGVTPAALPATIKKSQEAQLARLYAKDTAALEARKTRKLYEGFISSRKTLLQNQSQRRLRSPCVDFERIWWDRDLRGFSKSGISIWRPAPPPGYVSLGDCLETGHDPPRHTFVVRGGDIAEEGPETIPLTKAAQKFQLLWRDDSAAPQNALSIYKAIAPPGFVTMGCIAVIGSEPPKTGTVHCLRNDATVLGDRHGLREAWRYRPSRGTKFSAWICDETLSTFLLGRDIERPAAEDICHVKVLEQEERSAQALSRPQQSSQAGLNVVVNSGDTTLLLSDALRRSLMQIELGKINAGMSSLPTSVLQAHLDVQVSIWSFNSVIESWEPVMEPWGLLTKLELNRTLQVKSGVQPGMHLSVKSTSETVYMTLAYAAINACAGAYLEWRDLHASGEQENYKRQLAAADSSSIHSRVDNQLGVDVELALDFDSRVDTVEVKAGQHRQILQPLPRPPIRQKQHHTIAKDSQPAALLIADIGSTEALSKAGISSLEDAELFCAISLTNAASTSHTGGTQVRTRAVTPNSGGNAEWNEQLVLDLAAPSGEDMHELRLIAVLHDLAAEAGRGLQVGTAEVQLDISDWSEGHPHSQMLTFLGANSAEVTQLEISFALVLQHQRDTNEPTDAWNAEISTAGQRAMRIDGQEQWTTLASSSLQRSINQQQHRRKASRDHGPAAVVLPVRMPGGKGIALESSFQHGLKQERLRTLCQVVNSTSLTLEVSVVQTHPSQQPSPAAPSQNSRQSPRPRNSGGVRDMAEDTVFEHERVIFLKGWSPKYLLPTERKRFSRSADGASSDMEFPDIQCASGWEWQGGWTLDTKGNVDSDGWQYGSNFGLMRYPPGKGAENRGPLDVVRRRRWVRIRHQAKEEPPAEGGPSLSDPPTPISDVSEGALQASQSSTERQVLGRISPGDLLALPMGWNAPGKQVQVRPLLSGTGVATHAWSVGASEGPDTVLLDNMEEGITRLLTCSLCKRTQSEGKNIMEGDAQPSQAMEGLLMAPIWLSLSVEGDELIEGSHTPLTDWRIVIAAPLTVENQLPVKGTAMVWERSLGADNLAMRHSQHIETGKQIQVYSADMRRNVSLQFYPDGYELVEAEPTIISEGYSSHKAGVDGTKLPDKFLIQKTNGSEPPLGILLERDIDVESSLLDKRKLEPAAAVALGSSMKVRMYVPLWISNATDQLISAAVVPVSPPAQSQADQQQRQSRQPQSSMRDAAESMQLRILQTSASPAGSRRELSDAARLVNAGSVAMMVYPVRSMAAVQASHQQGQQQQQQAAQDARLYHGLKLKVGESGWSAAIPLESTSTISQAQDFNTKPVLLRAPVQEWGVMYEVVARLELVGGGFERTMVLRLESHVILSNRTGVPLQVMQYSSAATMQPLSQAAIGVEPASGPGLPRGQPGQNYPPGLKGAIVDQSVDWTTCMELPADAGARPLQWGMTADHRARLKHIARTDQGQAGSGPESMDEVGLVVLRFSIELRSPGCYHIVLESMSPRAPYHLENRTSHPLLYRQAGKADLPYQTLPPLSAAGFIFQPTGLDESRHEVELKESYGGQQSGLYSLEPADAASSSKDASMMLQRQATSSKLANLKISAPPGECIVALLDRQQAMLINDGLITIGSSASIGRGDQERMLRILPGKKGPYGGVTALLDAPATGAETAGQALYITASFTRLEISVVDQKPEEVLAATFMGLKLESASGIGQDGSFSSLRFQLSSIQLDDQLPNSRCPVLLCPAGQEEEVGAPPLVQLTAISQPGLPHNEVYYPYLSFRIERALQVSVNEALVWRLVEVWNRLDLASLSRTGDDQQVQASTDTPVQISLVYCSDLTAAVSFKGDVSSRPSWAGGALSWALNLASFEGVPIQLTGFEMEHVQMLRSLFLKHVIGLIQGQLVGIAFGFIRSFGVFSGASGVLGAISAGLAGVAFDKDFASEQSQQRQERSIAGVGEGLKEGGGAFGRSLLSGFTGLVNKPLAGARRDGVQGFVQGVGRGIIGAAAQPVSGAFEFMSSTFEGIDAVKDQLVGRIKPSDLYKRNRLPRAIGGDGRLQPFSRSDGSERQARLEELGQALLRRAQDASGVGLMAVKRRLRTRYSADAYEEHMLLPDNDQVVMLTNRAFMLLSAPGFAAIHNAAARGAAHPSTNQLPAAELKWAVTWTDLLNIEARAVGQTQYANYLTIHRKGVPGVDDGEPLAYELRCFPNHDQARELQAIATKVHSKFFISVLKKSSQWAQRMAALPRQLQELPCSILCTGFDLLWHTDSRASSVVTIWRPKCPAGYKPLGDVAERGFDHPDPVQVYRDDALQKRRTQNAATAYPTAWVLIWRSNGSKPVTMWKPVAPAGYRALGTVIVSRPDQPKLEQALCVRGDLVVPSDSFEAPIWVHRPPELNQGPRRGAMALQQLAPYDPTSWKVSIWQVANAPHTFIAMRSFDKPPQQAANDVKPW